MNSIGHPHTFVTVGESLLLSSLDISYPQVVIVHEGDEVGVSRADLWIHAGARAPGLDLHRLDRSGLLKAEGRERSGRFE